jgi:hypothetical protein
MEDKEKQSGLDTFSRRQSQDLNLCSSCTTVTSFQETKEVVSEYGEIMKLRCFEQGRQDFPLGGIWKKSWRAKKRKKRERTLQVWNVLT